MTPLKIIAGFGRPGAMLILLFLCSCASPSSNRSQPPPDVILNADAGRGNWMFVTLQLANGRELPFFIDTGASGSCFDKSLEPLLGRRLGSATIKTLDAGEQQCGVYALPKLYLGGARLRTGPYVLTFDFRQLSQRAGRPILGVLGMDCLRHYCLQLDFQTETLRFLDPDLTDPAALGKAFPITFEGNRPFLHHVSLTGGPGTNSLIDTGCHADGYVEAGAIPGLPSGVARVPTCHWDGMAYTNLIVGSGGSLNLLGLRFLARHLVTLDFPKAVLYLKPTSTGPLLDPEMTSAVQFVRELREQGRLPGWTKDDRGAIYAESYPYVKVVDGRKPGDLSTWHFTAARVAPADPWQLQRAWRTDQNDRTLAEYPVP